MKIVVGQGSCGIATGAKKTSAEFERLIAEKNLNVKLDKTGCCIVELSYHGCAVIFTYVSKRAIGGIDICSGRAASVIERPT